MKKENATELSNSMQKRVDRQKKLEQDKRNNMIAKIVIIAVGALIAAAIIFSIGRLIYKSSKAITPSSDYSKGLTETGFIKGVTASNIVDLVDYKTLEISKSEVEFTDKEIDEEIESQKEAHKVLSDDAELEVKDGDKVNIDYVGSIDGEEFEGGNSGGNGSDLEIGSGTFIDNFEEQLIGSHPGDELTVNVTFPEDYQNTDLAGKNADFAVTVNGVYVLPEFDDDFVKEYLSDYGSTVEEYRKNLAAERYEKNLESKIEEKMLDGSTVTKYPKSVLKHAKSLQKYTDMQNFEYINKMYVSYYGTGYSSFSEYTGQTDEEYDASLDEPVKESLKESLVWQAVLEKEGETITEDEVRKYLTDTTGSDTFDQNVETYGKEYTMAMMIRPKAIETVKKYVKVK
ncbi:MAG: FKBP-type peptidyl-prolyl cis-trans isomerase [Lachnospiraceae bacterium]|nr:FKBP-type peptidyl-prolyl cis-trans isomerase [Lachnospiraceae bacterium]